MPHIDCKAVRAVGTNIERDVIEILEDVNTILPELSVITQALYTSVDISLAMVYTTAVSYMSEMVEGAAGCFRDMKVKLDACATAWDQQDQALGAGFQRALGD